MTQEKVAETKKCSKCGTTFDITDKDLEFYNKISPVFNSKKYPIPAPTLCPDCRQQRRLSFRNERKLYHRKCDLTGKQIISIYSPDKPYKVYEQSEWWSDKWDPLSYGREFDFNRSFFEQFDELLKKVPRFNLFSIGNENGDYLNFEAHSKNCYLNIGGIFNEDSYYNTFLIRCSDCLDNYWVFDSKLMYQCIDTYDSYNCSYLQDSVNCKDCLHSKDLVNCNHCIGCTGLRNKEYHILNKPVRKEEYLEISNRIKNDPEIRSKFLKEYDEFLKKFPKKNLNLQNCINTIGDYLKDVKDSYYCYDGDRSEGLKYGSIFSEARDSMDFYGFGPLSDMGYEFLSIFGKNHKIAFCLNGNDINECLYSDHCNSSSNLFGCIGLRNSQYCILNKQYSKDEYEALVPRIIEHMENSLEWGEFFPSSISPFGYNETVANDYSPLDKDVALGEGFKWSDYEKQNGYNGEFYEPLDISQYDEGKAGKVQSDKKTKELLNGILKCEVSGKPFRVIKQELDFYLKHDLPIPRRHPDQRHLDRMKLRNPRIIYNRKCDNCGEMIGTSFSSERPETVYCEECYKQIY